MNEWFLRVVNMSLAASVIGGAVLALRALLRKRLPRWTFYLLWAVVLARLLLPFSPPSPASAFNAIPAARPVAGERTALQFVEETGVDALAVSVGTVHGLYKGKPNIRIDILNAINEKLNMPLVLHGGSGIPEKDILACIRHGIAKINVNTEISVYTVEQTKQYLMKEEPHFSVLSLAQIGYVKEIVKKYMNFFRGSLG